MEQSNRIVQAVGVTWKISVFRKTNNEIVVRISTRAEIRTCTCPLEPSTHHVTWHVSFQHVKTSANMKHHKNNVKLCGLVDELQSCGWQQCVVDYILRVHFTCSYMCSLLRNTCRPAVINITLFSFRLTFLKFQVKNRLIRLFYIFLMW